MIEEYAKALTRLNANKNSKKWNDNTRGRAPHKPFLLLSILDGIETGWITDPYINLSQNLIETFFCYWNGIMEEDRNTTIALPFFHMHSEPFWELTYKEEKDKYKNSPSLGGLQTRVKYAVIEPKLFKWMQEEEGGLTIRSILIKNYFSNETQIRVGEISLSNRGAFHYAQQLDLLAATEPFVLYHDQNDNHYRKLEKNAQNREAGFRIEIRNNYYHTCAICRTKVQAPGGQSIVEGAHIVPWKDSRNDDPRNGLALCKTHHWMFDNYMLAVKPDYTIQLSSWLKKKGIEIQETLLWDQKKLFLPDEKRSYPAEEAFADHFRRYAEFHKN